MFEKKIHLPDLEKLLREGVHQSEIARQLKVSKQAISKAVRRLKRANDQAAISVSAPVIKVLVGSKIDGMKQLKKINDVVIHEINLLHQKIKDAEGKERESLIAQRLKHIAEVRKQLGLLLDICKELYNAEEVQHFQQTVLATIGEVDENVKDEIYQAIEYFQDNYVDEQKLNDLKSNMKYSFLMRLDTPESVASSLTRIVAMTGGIDAVDQLYTSIEKVTPEDIINAANKFLVKQKRTIVVLKGGQE